MSWKHSHKPYFRHKEPEPERVPFAVIIGVSIFLGFAIIMTFAAVRR